MTQSAVLHRLLFRVRPAPLTGLLKRVFRIGRTDVEIRLGARYRVDPVSHFGREILDTGIYEPAMTELVVELIRPGDAFLDVGANEAYFSVLAALKSRSGKVLAIEPQTRLHSVVEDNAQLNGVPNLLLCPVALSDAAGQIELELPPDANTGAASFRKQWRWGGSREAVPTETLTAVADAQGIAHARLIKIDCEGAERKVVEGAADFLSAQRADFVCVDFHPAIAGPEDAKWIDAKLREWGYHLTELASGIWLYYLPAYQGDLSRLRPVREIHAI